MDTLITLAVMLTVIVLALLLLFGLFSASWQVLLLILVIGLVATWWLTEQNRPQSIAQESGTLDTESFPSSQGEAQAEQPAKKQPLVYRGSVYKSSSSKLLTPSTQVEVVGKYRGSVWKRSPNSENNSVETHTIQITGKYRGCIWKSSKSEED